MTKANALTEDTNPADNDYLATWLNDATASRKVTVANLRRREYGYVYASQASGNQALLAATLAKVTQFATNGASSSGVTPDQANNLINLPIGTWQLQLTALWSHSVATELELLIYSAGVATVMRAGGTNAAATDIVSSSVAGQLVLASASDVEVYARAADAGDLAVKELHLSAHQIA